MSGGDDVDLAPEQSLQIHPLADARGPEGGLRDLAELVGRNLVDGHRVVPLPLPQRLPLVAQTPGTQAQPRLPDRLHGYDLHGPGHHGHRLPDGVSVPKRPNSLPPSATRAASVTSR